MKLKDLIENVDRSESNSNWIDINDIANALGISAGYLEDENQDLKEYWIFSWLCTDTYVGYSVVFINDKPLALVWQSGRKNDRQYSFVSEEAVDEARNYIFSLMKSKLSSSINFADMDEECGVGMTVAYGTQLLVSKVIYEGEMVSVVKVYGQHYSGPVEMWSKIDIKKNDGTILTVELDRVTVPFNLKDSK